MCMVQQVLHKHACFARSLVPWRFVFIFIASLSGEYTCAGLVGLEGLGRAGPFCDVEDRAHLGWVGQGKAEPFTSSVHVQQVQM